MISRRTKEALAAAKARGVKLGTSGKKMAADNAAAAAARDAELEPVLKELSQLSSRVVAAEIERRGHGKVSRKLVQRARVRLGLNADPRRHGKQRLPDRDYLTRRIGACPFLGMRTYPRRDARRRATAVPDGSAAVRGKHHPAGRRSH